MLNLFRISLRDNCERELQTVFKKIEKWHKRRGKNSAGRRNAFFEFGSWHNCSKIKQSDKQCTNASVLRLVQCLQFDIQLSVSLCNWFEQAMLEWQFELFSIVYWCWFNILWSFAYINRMILQVKTTHLPYTSEFLGKKVGGGGDLKWGTGYSGIREKIPKRNQKKSSKHEDFFQSTISMDWREDCILFGGEGSERWRFKEMPFSTVEGAKPYLTG